jgi:hypothetical protein
MTEVLRAKETSASVLHSCCKGSVIIRSYDELGEPFYGLVSLLHVTQVDHPPSVRLGGQCGQTTKGSVPQMVHGKHSSSPYAQPHSAHRPMVFLVKANHLLHKLLQSYAGQTSSNNCRGYHDATILFCY